MELIADGLLIATAMTAGLYCLVLSRRLRQLTDSGDGIGSQIDALDQALRETRAALTETREGVSELRGSTKAAFEQLARETARGGEMAERIERGVDEAKATMQRLYETRGRIEAHENRPENGDGAGEDNPDSPPDGHGDAGAGEDAPVIEAQPVTVEIPSIDGADEGGESAGDSGGADSATGPKVALPEGKLVKPGAVSAAATETTSERSGSVLKAERVVL